MKRTLAIVAIVIAVVAMAFGVLRLSVLRLSQERILGASNLTAKQVITLLDGVATSTNSTWVAVNEFQHVVCDIDIVGSTSTLYFAGTIEPPGTALDIDNPQSATNSFEYIEVIDLEDGSLIDGDTGITSTLGGSDHRLVQLNTKLLRQMSVSWDRTTGTTTVRCIAGDNR